MADTHGAQEPHDPPHDTSDHGHDEAVSDTPIARPDGTMPPSDQRPLSLGIGIAGTLILLLVVAGVILYLNRNGDTATAPAESNAAGGAAPEAILTNASLKDHGTTESLASANVTLGQLQPGTYKQQAALVKPVSANTEKSISLKAATAAARTPTPGAGKATATPTKAAAQTTWQDPDGRFTVRLPAGWTADDSDKNDWFVVEFDGTDAQGGPYFLVFSEDASDGTLDDFIAIDQKTHADNTKFTIKDGAVTDTTVAGEPAKTMTYTYVSKAKPNATPATGQLWEFIHNGQRWRFGVDPIGSHRSEVAALVSAFTFTDSNDNNGNGDTTTFTDPGGLITLSYPNTWTTATLDGDDANVLYIKSPDGASFSLDISDQAGTPADEMKTVKDNRGASTGFKYTFGNIVDLKIGGEPAKMLPWTWASKQNASAKGAGRDYIVNHGGKWFGITAVAPTTDAFADQETIITSSSFGGNGNGNNGSNGNTTTWKDKDGTVQLQVPNGWTASVDTSYDGNLVTLDAPTGEYFYIDLLDPFDSLDTVITNIKANHAKSDKYTYKDGDVKDVQVGGEPAKVLSYTYQQKGKTGAPTYQAKIWVYNHGGKGYYMSGSPLDQVGPTVDAIVTSIKFLQ